MLPHNLERLRAQHPAKNLSINGQNWKIIDVGSGSLPLVMLPGALGSADSFYKQILHFSHEGRVISANYPLSSDPSTLVDSFRQLLDQLHIDEIVLFGTSLGGYIAQRFYEKWPDMVRKLIIGNSFVDSSRLLSTEMFDPMLARNHSANELLTLWRQRIEHNVAANGSSELSDVTLDFLRTPANAEQLKARLLTLAHSERVIGETAAKVAIIDCENDAIVDPETRQECRHCYPNARIYSLSEGGHYPYILNSAQFNDIITTEIADYWQQVAPATINR